VLTQILTHKENAVAFLEKNDQLRETANNSGLALDDWKRAAVSSIGLRRPSRFFG